MFCRCTYIYRVALLFLCIIVVRIKSNIEWTQQIKPQPQQKRRPDGWTSLPKHENKGLSGRGGAQQVYGTCSTVHDIKRLRL